MEGQKKTLQKKDSQTSEALSQAERWKEQAEEREKQIQRLLSEKQELVSTVAEQGKRIAEQTEHIEKLHDADNILKKYWQIKIQNIQLESKNQEAIQKADNMIQTCKAEYEKKLQELEQQKKQVKNQQHSLEISKAFQDIFIEGEAERITEAARKRLEQQYQAKIARHKGFMAVSVLCVILYILVTAIQSEAFISDFKMFFLDIWSLIRLCARELFYKANTLAQLGNKIPQPTAAMIVRWIIIIVSVVIIASGIGSLLFLTGRKVYKVYRKNFADLISLAVFLVSFAIAVYFAKPIKSLLPINIVVLLILLHVVYAIIRGCIKGVRERISNK